MASQKLTNFLLLVIAALLLVLVVRGPSGKKSPHGAFDFPAGMSEKMPEMPKDEPMNPETAKEFHPAEMVIGSLSCPSDGALTLSDAGCTGKEADERRKLVEDGMAKNLPISKIYDQVVAKYGEKALTESALSIRKGRRDSSK
jgi:hypothetical protein